MTDTLDAIAREMRKEAETPYSVQTCHSNTLKRWAARITALSNQGEGAVVSALEVFRIAGGDTECTPNPSAAVALDCLRDLRQCYDEQPEAEADRRDAERVVGGRMRDLAEANEKLKAERAEVGRLLQSQHAEADCCDAVTEEAITALVAGPYMYHHKMDNHAMREGKAFDRCRELTIQNIQTFFATRRACDAATQEQT